MTERELSDRLWLAVVAKKSIENGNEDKMKAFMISGALKTSLEDIPVPEPGKGEVRVKVSYVGICGSDLHYYGNGANGEFVIREPLIPGHEVSGTVDLDPSGELSPGTPVTIHPARFGKPVPGLEDRPRLWPGCSYLGSASTWPHTQGGLCEFLVMKKANLRVLPDNLPVRRAALAEPLSVALHGINIAGEVSGKSVLVSGSGPIGLLSAAGALARGAARVVTTDLLPGPLQRARAVGAQDTVQIGVQDLPTSEFDVVLECTGVVGALPPLLAATKPTGVIAQVGMIADVARETNLSLLLTKELQLRGSFCFGYVEFDEAIKLLAANPKFDNVITHVLSIDEAPAAFAVAKDSESSGKVLISPVADLAE